MNTISRIIVALMIVLFAVKPALAQDNVGIGTTTPQLKALLDLTSNEKGLLVPRMTTAERLAIAPALNDYWGLLVYDLTINGYHFWNGNSWVHMNDFDPSNELDSLDYDAASFQLTFFSNGNMTTFDLSGLIDDNDADTTNELQSISIINDTIFLSNGGQVGIPVLDDNDADTTNELQTLFLNAAQDSLFITNGNGVPFSLLGSDDQMLSINGDTIFIEASNFVVLEDNDSTNEIQLLSISNDTIFLTNGGFVMLPVINDDDSDSTNEIQTLSISNDTIFLSNGGFVMLPVINDDDSDSTNEIQTLSISNDTIFLTNGGFVMLPVINDGDSDSTNEIQTLSYNATGDTLIISGGNMVPVPIDVDWTVAGASMYNNNTGNVGIGIPLPNASLHVVGNNGFVHVGTFGAGAIPVIGAGVRMQWYSAEAAFRAGGVGGGQWDAVNTGNYSAAFGFNPTASGNNSFSAGNGPTASGLNAVAFGNTTTASGNNSFATGDGSDASNTGAFAGGTGTTASGTNAVAFGNMSQATGGTSFSGGSTNLSSGFNAFSYGSNSIASGQDAFALGTTDTASGFSSFAAGGNSHASSDQSFAFGSYAKAYGFQAIALGVGAEARGFQSIAMGTAARTLPTANFAVAMGFNTVSSGQFSHVIGSNAADNGFNGCFVYGDNSLIPPNPIVTPAANNQFVARAANGFFFYTNGPATVGAQLPAGGNAWVVISDSTRKENFKPVDGEQLLQKIAAFQLGTWNYKDQDPAKFRHYGPMAQDFYSAFGNDGIGTIGTATTIGTADFSGVNFNAIHALEKRTREQADLIEQQRSQIRALQEALNEVMGRVQNLELENGTPVKSMSADKK